MGMNDAVLLAGGLFLVIMQFAGPFLLARLLQKQRWTATKLLALCLAPGALLGAVLGFREHDLFPNLFAGGVMALPPALIAIICLRWSRSKPNGAKAFYNFLWWSLSCAWFFSIGGFILMGLLAAALVIRVQTECWERQSKSVPWEADCAEWPWAVRWA